MEREKPRREGREGSKWGIEERQEGERRRREKTGQRCKVEGNIFVCLLCRLELLKDV